jgi:hypothetical protein
VNPKPVREARGGSAEWCSKCSLKVLPVVSQTGGTRDSWRWVCPNCFVQTEPAVRVTL